MLVVAVAGVILALIFSRSVVKNTWSAEEISRSIQIVWHESKWVDKRAKPGEAVIVPSITFRVKNVGTRSLQYVDFQGIFAFVEGGENLSDGFIQAIRDPLAPGQESGEIFIKSFYGYTASSKEAFIKNSQEWKKVKAKIFAKSKGSEYVLLGVFSVEQTLEGVNVIYQTGDQGGGTVKDQ
jgi:hypothetical protein